MSPRYSESYHLIAELLSAEDVEVQVHDSLAAVRAAVVDDAVAAAEPFCLGYLGNGYKQRATHTLFSAVISSAQAM